MLCSISVILTWFGQLVESGLHTRLEEAKVALAVASERERHADERAQTATARMATLQVGVMSVLHAMIHITTYSGLSGEAQSAAVRGE